MNTILKHGEGNSNPLQYSCLENSMDGGAWWAAVQGVTNSQTQLSDFTFFLSIVPFGGKATHSSVLAGESRGQRRLVGCNLWGCKESDKTKQLTHRLKHFQM